MYGCRIELQHDQAKAFFEEVLHPDMEELQRRDAFFERLEQEINYQVNGSSITMEIPDVDIDMLLGAEKKYTAANDLSYSLSLGTTANIKNRDSAYSIKATQNIAA